MNKRKTLNHCAALAACAVCVVITACATTDQNASTVSKTVSKTASKPLEIININQAEIPDYMQKLSRPYDTRGTQSCGQISSEIAQLDEFLGADYVNGLSEIPTDEKYSDNLSAVAASLIPYKGVIKFLSGSMDRETAVRTATNLGNARRGYLHGWRAAKNCS